MRHHRDHACLATGRHLVTFSINNNNYDLHVCTLCSIISIVKQSIKVNGFSAKLCISRTTIDSIEITKVECFGGSSYCHQTIEIMKKLVKFQEKINCYSTLLYSFQTHFHNCLNFSYQCCLESLNRESFTHRLF